MTLKQRATTTFESLEPELRKLSRWLYEHPEIQYQEYESSAKLAAFLDQHGFEVAQPSHGLDTAFEANAGDAGPRVIICCEYDALPEVGHACGHNIIATAAVGAGVALAPLVNDLGIRVTVLGTPAEEGAGGKVDLIEAGAFEDTAASMMVHPYPHDLMDPSFQARTSFTVEYRGKESHAAFAPHQGVNALDAFVQAYMNVATLRQQILSSDRVHCIIDHGGDANNIIPSYTKSTWGIRSGDGDRLRELIPKVRACFEAAAQATGCDIEINQTGHSYINMITNPVIADLFRANSAALGRPMPTEEEVGFFGGSSDMGNVSHVVPSIHPMISIDTHGAANHQKEFADATITESGEKAIRDGALAMAHTIIDMAEQNVWSRLDSPST
ncbi:MAG: M20 family metallopeptidase [Actinomycetota bacterium]